MANHGGDGGGDDVIRQRPAVESVNLNVEGNARPTGDRALTSSAMMTNIAEIDNFNKNFNPKDYSTEQLTAMLAANQAGIDSTREFLSSRSRDLVKASNVANAEMSGYIQPLTIHQDV